MSQLQRELYASKRVLTRCHEEKNGIKEKNQWKAKEVENLRSQMVQALEENHKLKGGIFGKS